MNVKFTLQRLVCALSVCVWAVVVALPLPALGAERPAFENEPGWTWHMRPESANWSSTATQGIVMRQDELKDGKLLLTLAHTQDAMRDVVRLRPVAFDAKGQRFELQSDSGGSTGNAAMKAYTLDLKVLPKDQFKYLGIEKLTKHGLETVVAPAAHQKLKDARVDVLPLPRIGEPYEFELTTIDGKKISSKDFRGKVVLLDFWARWCGPCMAKMPKLKETYARLHDRGFEVIGINHDNTLEVANQTITEQKLPWANVLAPTADDQRHLWYTATGTNSLPRLLLIDREGILRADTTPHALVGEIEKLLGNP
jgi:thiol-disulfide isomerase/thioredoxin